MDKLALSLLENEIFFSHPLTCAMANVVNFYHCIVDGVKNAIVFLVNVVTNLALE